MVGYYLLIALCIVALIAYGHQFKAYAKYFVGLFVALILLSTSELVGITGYHEWVNYLFSPVELTFISLAYLVVLRGKWVRPMVYIYLAFSWVIVLYSAYHHGYHATYDLGILLSHSGIFFLSMVYLYELYKPPFLGTKIFQTPFFWINIGNFIFYSGDFLQVAIQYQLTDLSPDLEDALFYISLTFNYLLFLSYLLGFTCQRIFK